MKNRLKTNYKLLDCGEFEKLEQIGDTIIRRPAPQANWKQKLNGKTWENNHVKFDPLKSEWIVTKELPKFKCAKITMELRLSANGQIGIFPEQLSNWWWLHAVLSKAKRPLNILNGFAYTGASTLFASIPNTVVTHVDASASSVNWAKRNCKLSNLENNNIRWIVDDILTYLKREVKRGVVYDGIILDPPAFGRGKNGTTWKLKRDLPRLMYLADQLLNDDPEFMVLSCHDNEFGAQELKNELKKLQKINRRKIETMYLTINSETANDLPAGECARWKK